MRPTPAGLSARVWVLGAGGMLGRAVMARLAVCQREALGSGREVDIASAAQVMDHARQLTPTHIINCAAYTRVDACESDEAAAQATNGRGPGHVAAAAMATGAHALHVSTDYVFDGTAHKPYVETSACAPMGAYGRSKRQGELAFAAAMVPTAADPGNRGPRGYLVRTSWLFGHGGANFVATMLGLMASRDELAVVADQVGRPTYCDDLAAAIVALLGLDSGDVSAPAGGRGLPAAAGTYHFANEGETSWHGFARAILDQAEALGTRLTCRLIRAIATADYPTPARRPAYSVLSTAKVARVLGRPPRHWQQALGDYLATDKQHNMGGRPV